MVARGDYVLMADADGATKFSDFELLEDQMQNIEKNNHGLVVGSRAHLQSAAVAKVRFKTFLWQLKFIIFFTLNSWK